jgi:hypothetical protein
MVQFWSLSLAIPTVLVVSFCDPSSPKKVRLIYSQKKRKDFNSVFLSNLACSVYFHISFTRGNEMISFKCFAVSIHIHI